MEKVIYIIRTFRRATKLISKVRENTLGAISEKYNIKQKLKTKNFIDKSQKWQDQ